MLAVGQPRVVRGVEGSVVLVEDGSWCKVLREGSERVCGRECGRETRGEMTQL